MNDLAQRLADGVAALRGGRPGDAARLLAPVAHDPALAEADDLADVRARTLSLYAQALFEAGRVEDADRACRDAVRAVRAVRDREGLDVVRDLQDRIVKAIAHDAERAQRLQEQRRVAATPLDDLLGGVDDPADRVGLVVKKAGAHLAAGDPDEATSLARRAAAEADALDHVRWRVMSRIVWSQAAPAEAAEVLEAAYRAAERADEFNLVATVARAADDAGVGLPKEAGPHAAPAPEDP